MAPALSLVLALTVAACCAAAAVAAAAGGGRVDLWPMPASVSRGAKTLYVAKDLKLSTAGSTYADRKAILADAFRRMVAVVQMDHVINGSYAGLPVLAGVRVAVSSLDDELKFGVDESYKLTVPATGNPIYAQIEAQTVFGALHALETFSQLCYFDFILSVTGLHSAPWTIIDKPRFPYRGLLIDTARHYLPVPVIKGVIDSMTYSKLNVLHWHIVDEQSFPLEIPSYPKLSNGAYSYSEKYTMNDALDIVQGIGYPALSPSATSYYESVISLKDPIQIYKSTCYFEERLWTPIEKLAKDPTAVTARLAHFRCLLNERGVAAAPLAGYGRTAPSGPDS